jgi:aspartate kinase
MTADQAELSFSVPRADLDKALALTREVARAIEPATRVLGDANIAKLYVLGVGMRTHTGVARKMFGALARHGINISMINTSEVRITVVVDADRGAEALAALKEAFNLA